MIKQYFKQSLVLLQQNKLLSVIAIIGTALAIAMIMCIVLIYQARTANYEPEINRDRTLSIEMTIAQKIDDKGWNMGNQLSLRTIKECFYPMTTAEAVSAVHYSMTSLAATPDGTREVKCAVSYTDDNFWRVFGFRFLHGKPYGQEFVSGEKKLVVTRSLARRLFGIDNAVGRIISLGFVDYTVCGVVADVGTGRGCLCRGLGPLIRHCRIMNVVSARVCKEDIHVISWYPRGRSGCSSSRGTTECRPYERQSERTEIAAWRCARHPPDVFGP